jgi:nitroreductase
MDVFEAVKTRKSVRKSLDKPVEEEKLSQILEAARLAPSASNRQEWRFVVVRDKDTRMKLAEASGAQMFIAEAAVVLAACAETDGKIMHCGLPCHPIDVAIALDHITLAAVELGLGTCWIGHFDAPAVKKILGIPDEIVVVSLMPLGYPADPAAIAKKRLSKDQILHWEHW